MEKQDIQERNVPSKNHHRALRKIRSDFALMEFKRLQERNTGLKTLSSFLNENGSKVSITGQRGLQINEIENFQKEKKLEDQIRGNHQKECSSNPA
ncbi:hypothetical protein Tco_0889269 [Tanacetum coccineum]